jgi:hypothetical protein
VASSAVTATSRPWTNSFDVKISQEIPGFFARNKGNVSLDILNFGNLLNKKWGHIKKCRSRPPAARPRGFVDYAGLDAQGRYVYAVRTSRRPERSARTRANRSGRPGNRQVRVLILESSTCKA